MPVLVLANKQDLPTAVDLPGLEKGEIVRNNWSAGCLNVLSVSMKKSDVYNHCDREDGFLIYIFQKYCTDIHLYLLTKQY